MHTFSYLKLNSKKRQLTHHSIIPQHYCESGMQTITIGPEVGACGAALFRATVGFDLKKRVGLIRDNLMLRNKKAFDGSANIEILMARRNQPGKGLTSPNLDELLKHNFYVHLPLISTPIHSRQRRVSGRIKISGKRGPESKQDDVGCLLAIN